MALLSSGAAYADDAPPVVTSISPASATLSSVAAAVTISGSNFRGSWNDDTQVSVSVDGEPAAFSFFNDDGTIGALLLAPAAIGTQDITVTTPAGTSATSSADQFTWLPDPSSDATLSALTASAGTFQSEFGSRPLSDEPNGAGCNVTYQLDVPYSAASITMTPTASDAGASITVNDTPVDSGSASGDITLGVGSNLNAAKIVVTAADGFTTETYCVTATRAAAPVTAPFSGLSISPGALDQSFSTLRDDYTATLPYADSSATISWTTDYPDATIVVFYTVGSDSSVVNGTVNGDGTSTSIPLAAGTVTKVTIQSTQAGGSAAEIYQINITRSAASADASLSALTPSAGALSPDFTADTLDYAVAVGNATASITLTPVTTDSNAGVTVASGAASSAVTLPVGPLAIAVVVTAEDGTTHQTYTVTVTRAAPQPTIDAVLPATGPVAGGTAVTITGTGFTGATSVTFGGSPATGLNVDSDTQLEATAPAGSHGAADVVVTAPGGTATLTNGYTYVTAPIAAAASTTVAANSSDNDVTLGLSGDAATAVAVIDQPGHGTATASGTAITYTPVAGYSGPDSFTYSATNAGGTSASATASITVSAATLVLSPEAGALPGGTVGAAYSQTIAASAGGGSYNYVVSNGALPDGLSLDASTGIISGTPTAGGPFSFTVYVTDAYSGIGVAAYTIDIADAPPPASTLTLSPLGGALPPAMVGEAYSAGVTASGGTGVVIYSVSDGALPDGLTLNVSTGALTGPLGGSVAPGDYSFTLSAHDNGGGSISGSFTLHVAARAVTSSDKTQDVPPGTPPTNVDLTAGATGGPFFSASIVSVRPANAGTATIVGSLVAGPPPPEPNLYLKFVPAPGFSGRVVVDFSLTSTLGTSNTASVTYDFLIDAAAAATEVDSLVRGFVTQRQALLSGAIKLPGLLDRRAMSSAATPGAAHIAADGDGGVALNFATSTAQLEASRAAAGLASGLPGTVVEPSPLNIWASGTAEMHSSEDGGRWGNFALFSAGVDYLLSNQALIGLSFHLDHMTDPVSADAHLTGNGWLVGPYGSFEIARGIFLDTSLLYGGSVNSIDTGALSGSFDTFRGLSDTSLYGQWQLDEATTLTPRLRLVYQSETAAAYEVANNAGAVVEMPGFTEQQLRLSLGAELTHEFVLGNGLSVIPTIGFTAGLSALDEMAAFGSASAGLRLTNGQSWTIDAGINADAAKSVGGKFGVAGHF